MKVDVWPLSSSIVIEVFDGKVNANGAEPPPPQDEIKKNKDKDKDNFKMFIYM